MEEKIKFYEEALAADPNSTLFFPLAELYRQQGSNAQAVEVLQKGLSGHPEHLRARCLLVALLHGSDDKQELAKHLAVLTDVLEEIPDLWLAWADKLDREGRADAALAAYFLSASLRGDAVTWAGLLEQGLRAVVPSLVERKHPAIESENETVQEAPAISEPSIDDDPDVDARQDSADDASPMKEDTEAPPRYKAVSYDLGPSASELQPMIDVVEVQQPAVSEGVEEAPPEEGDEPETSIRTKTMADILVDQGDYAKALEIYEEILEREDAAEHQEEIRKAIALVREKLSESKEKKLLNTLEKLADKLEAKSAGTS